MADILYQGHASFRLTSENGTVVYIDPYAGDGYEKAADAVIISHEHFDHNKVEKATLKNGGVIYRAKDFLVDGNYYEKNINGISVRGTPACNKNHPVDKCVGFLITVDGKKIYIAADTAETDYMSKELPKEKLDYAFLPTDGIYTMTAERASECAKKIGAKHSAPVHTNPDVLFDREIALRFNADGGFLIEPGEEITL